MFDLRLPSFFLLELGMSRRRLLTSDALQYVFLPLAVLPDVRIRIIATTRSCPSKSFCENDNGAPVRH
jgi:hypothetical protein